ncbi:tetraacyldisaccharide 4'-kinase [Trichlorobacter ammonificans]|uniref:tetraacyldisaccharide 4'-kinase n=1 Tax=Trichlorobacter ammonificans TaxID=2916410 RepID=UPI002737FA18|nr:tetraacyldisaccharide 4'-kinase [Trichlorobacter ammonificans]
MKSRLESYWRAMADGSNRSPGARLLTLVLLPVALLYGALLGLRPLFYRWRLFTTHRLPVPVISIGNITVGGTGKTPVTALVAKLLMDQGLKVAVLSRGYGGSLEGSCAVVSDGGSLLLTPQQCGDEPYLLARSLPGLSVVVGADRYRAGQLAVRQLSPDVFLLDDGFQHLRLYRDLNILLLDCRRPFGNGLSLPAGLLREPRGAAERADLLILTRCNDAAPAAALPDRPCCRSRHRLVSFHRLDNGTPLDVSLLAAARTVAFAGIADPAGFFSALEATGIRPIARLPLPDHEPYGGETLGLLEQMQQAAQAAWLLTTEKDAVKLLAVDEQLRSRIVAARLAVELEDAAPLTQALERVIQQCRLA